jgi:hypothetical protein
MTLDIKQGSGPPMPRCEVLCRGLCGNEVVTAVLLTIPFVHWAAPCHINAFHLHRVLYLFPGFRGIMEHKNKRVMIEVIQRCFSDTISFCKLIPSGSGIPPRRPDSISQAREAK